MFKLANRNTETNALALVEDLINMPMQEYPTHLIYSDGYVEYVSELHGTTPEYFTHSGWYKYIADHLDKIEFKDDHAVYQLINLKMQKNKLFVSTADLMEQNERLTQKVAQLTYELMQTREINSFTGVLFSGVYPTWKTEAEFSKLDDYKYISLVLDKTVDSFDHNFKKTYIYGLSQYHQNEYSGKSSVLPDIIKYNKIKQPFTINMSMRDHRFAIPFTDSGPWIEDLNWHWYHAHRCKYTAEIFKKSETTVNDSVLMYIIGVIAGWIHLNLDKILPYEYLIFIDCNPRSISFKLVTLKKHDVCPKRFLYDWRRFIITGILHEGL
jgi:hypothetical protein